MLGSDAMSRRAWSINGASFAALLVCVSLSPWALAIDSGSILGRSAPQLTQGQTRQLRAAVASLCGNRARPLISADSEWRAQAQEFAEPLRTVTDMSEAINLSREALRIAQNLLGEGGVAESWQLLCQDLEMQVRVFGLGAPRT